MLEKHLQDLGLTDKEAELYVTMLGMDNASVLDLSKKTKINRTTIYLVLESLMKKGLASEVQVDKKVNYQAEPPERLETYVERQKIVIEEQSKRIKDLIPQLKSVERETGERPVVKYFEGRDGVVSSMQDFLDTKSKEKNVYMVYPRDLIEENFSPEELDKLREIRIKRGIKSHAIYTYKKGDRSSDTTADRIKIDGDKYPITCDISIYGDKTKINILGDNIGGISVVSKDLANTLRSLIRLVFDKEIRG